jgi:putative ABC transport system permease protein
MRDWTSDLLHSFRRLRHSPAHVGTAVLCLAIGVAASATVFSLLNAILYRELPGIVDRDALRNVWLMGGTDPGDMRSAVTVAGFRRIAQLGPGVAAEAAANVTARVGGDAVNAGAAFVSGNYFSVFGTVPSSGRLLNVEDDRLRSTVAVVSHRFWETHLSGRKALPSEPILIGEHSVTVIGVAPEGFSGLEISNPGEAAGSRIQFWLPLSIAAQWPGTPPATSTWPRLFLRVADGEAAEVSTIRTTGWTNALSDGAGAPSGVRVLIQPFGMGPHDVPGQVLLMFGLFMAVPLIVLAIGCANVANLQIARAIFRLRELAVRRSLGATNRQIARLLTAEAALIAIAAGGCGTALTAGVLTAVQSVFPLPLAVDWRVLAFTLVLVMAVVFLTGMWPAWSIVKRGAGARTLMVRSSDTPRGRTRHVLVVVQLGLSLVLLVVAALFSRSLEGMYRQASPSMREVLLVRFDLETSGLSTTEARRFSDELIARLGQDSRVSGAGMSAPGGFEYRLPGASSGAARSIAGSFVDPSWFDAMSVAPVVGRLARPGAENEAVVSARLSRQLAPGRSPIGRTMLVESALEPGRVRAVQVVGVVPDIPRRPHDLNPDPVLYLPRGGEPVTSFFVTVRTSSPDAVSAHLRSIVRTVDPRVAWTSLQTAEEAFLLQTGDLRYVAAAVGGLGLIALILAASGLFATLSYVVSLRTREIGIRIAIGASPASIFRLILGQAVRLAGAGVGVGLALAVPIAFLLRAMFEGISPFDPWAIVPTIGTLMAVALAAAALPARLAARTNAVDTIRQDA